MDLRARAAPRRSAHRAAIENITRARGRVTRVTRVVRDGGRRRTERAVIEFVSGTSVR